MVLKVCRRIFWQRSLINLKIVEKHWENITDTSFNDIGDIIRKKIIFKFDQHKGMIVPVYYTYGIPSFMWTCRLCLETTT